MGAGPWRPGARAGWSLVPEAQHHLMEMCTPEWARLPLTSLGSFWSRSRLPSRWLRLAQASSSPRELIDPVLAQAGRTGLFDATASTDEVDLANHPEMSTWPSYSSSTWRWGGPVRWSRTRPPDFDPPPHRVCVVAVPRAEDPAILRGFERRRSRPGSLVELSTRARVDRLTRTGVHAHGQMSAQDPGAATGSVQTWEIESKGFVR
jgi:hypothetical protein